MEPSDLAIPPPIDRQKFERCMQDLFAAEWGRAELRGPTGQPQNGIDVYGQKKPLPPPVARRLGRAIALCNTYGFGYALGMNFRNPQGRREMLWPQDMDEIALNGRTENGCGIAGAGKVGLP